MSALLPCDAAGRIVAQRLEYGDDAVGDGERPAEFSYDDAGRLTRTHANPGPQKLRVYNPQNEMFARI